MILQYELLTTTQALEFYPPEGVPSSATVGIYIDATHVLLSPVSVTLDTASQTLGAHAQGAQTLTVTSSAAFAVGRRYWLDDGYRGYEVEIYAIPAGGTTLVLTEKLRRAITSGTIKGHGLRRTLTAAESGTERRLLRVVWKYTAAGAARTAEQFVDVVRWPFTLPITEDDLEAADASFGEEASAAGNWRQYVAGATIDLAHELWADGLEVDRVRPRDLLVRPAVFRALQLRHVRDDVLFARFGGLYAEALRALRACMARQTVRYDTDGTY